MSDYRKRDNILAIVVLIIAALAMVAILGSVIWFAPGPHDQSRMMMEMLP